MSNQVNRWNQTDRNLEAPDSPNDHQPDAVGTPEGDNEFLPNEPLAKLPDDAEQIPRGNAPDSYKGE